jgi:Phage Mu protein F like protein
MSRGEDERSLGATVGAALRRWLDKARAVTMRSGNPDPTAIYGLQSQWDSEVDTILSEIGRIGISAWSSATDVPPVSRHAFIVSYLADVQNLLVRIPDEVANLVFAEITDGTNAGESRDQIAARVDKVLSFTGSERWPNRAKVIAQTEVNRAYGAGTMAAGIEQARVTGRQLTKRWDTKDDNRVRSPHQQVDGQTVPVWYPFYVDGVPMMFPGDPSAPPELVINCRCQLHIGNEVTHG